MHDRIHLALAHERARTLHERAAATRRARSAPRPRRRAARVALAVAAALAALPSAAQAAVTAGYDPGTRTLRVFGDGSGNSIVVGRDAAGKLLVNGGAVVPQGGTATVANTARIEGFAQSGDDVLALDERNGALPRADLFGGAGSDALTGGSGADMLFGQSGTDVLQGKGGEDRLFGGEERDTLTGGDADDAVDGQGGDDRSLWNPGDDSDTFAGASGTDSLEVAGGNGDEQFTVAPNGTAVRLSRTTPAPFTIDAGSVEHVVLDANGGADRFSAAGDLAMLTRLVVDGGAGADTVLGGNGSDVLLGGEGDDVVDGNQGSDVALLGAGEDRFGWEPGDDSDVVEGQDGVDRLALTGSNANERLAISASGARVRVTRDVGSVALDVGGTEELDAALLGGGDAVTVGDLSGTGVTSVNPQLSLAGGIGDARLDRVTVDGTDAADRIAVSGIAGFASVAGLPATTFVTGAEPSDALEVRGLGGTDVIDISALRPRTVAFTAVQ
ncbi:MAG TPA: hypothetical protein VF533_05005 [Solirubrobacteraceae bacterium]|jgi:hypothetical protein